MAGKDYDDHLQNLNELVKRYEESLRMDLHSFFSETDLEEIVEYYLEQQDMERAGKACEEGLEQYRYSPTFYVKKAEIYIELNIFEEAWDILEKASTFSPNDISILLHKADVKTNLGDYDEAITLVERALELSDESERSDLLLELADIYEEWEKYHEVIECLQACLEIDSDNEEALNRMWFCVELTERYKESAKYHKRMVDKHPYNELLWYNLAHAYNGMGKYDLALEAFEFVTAIDENYDPAYIDSGDIFYRTKLYKKAIDAYQEAIAKGAPKKELYYYIGKCYSKLDLYSKARDFYKKCVTIDPYFAKAFHKMGLSFLKSDLLSNAVSPLERAVKLDAKNIEYMKSLGIAYVKNDEVEKALVLYSTLLEKNDLDKSVHLHYISALYEKGCIVDALEHLDDTIDIFDEDYSLLFIKTAFLIEIGRRNEGLATLTIAMQLCPKKSYQLFEMIPELIDDEEVVQLIEQFKA